jgi:hypothetical protein
MRQWPGGPWSEGDGAAGQARCQVVSVVHGAARPPGHLSSGCIFPLCRALGARTQLAQKRKRINPGRVAVGPVDLHGIAAYQLGAFGPQGFRSEYRDGAARNGGPRFQSRAACTRAFVAQVAVGIGAQVTVGPLDQKRIVSGGELDFRWRDLQGGLHSPLSVASGL